MGNLGRLQTIQRVFIKYGLDDLFLSHPVTRKWQKFTWLSPSRWFAGEERNLPRGERLRLALEELGPVFVKLGQMLSTRRDLLPDDIGDELQKLQDRVPPFPGSEARARIEKSLGAPVTELFADFDEQPMASASIAQVHAVTLNDGSDAIVKVLRPGISAIIERDLGLMHTLAALAERWLPDGPRLRPREVVREYERSIRNELDLQTEASNAAILKQNFIDSDKLYVPDIHWELCRQDMLVQERIYGIPIRDVETMQSLGMNMKLLAEHGVEIFYTQVFQHNFFHADMHPGNIFVSPDNPEYPTYIAVDFGIVGSLTLEDQRYLGENLLAFFERDYHRVAQLHIDSGWVPPDTRVGELESSIRSVCEPLLNKPLAEISFGDVLLRLFNVARRFNMEVQPQLVLLQKTLMNIEGLGRDLYPDLDLWETGKPHLRRWMATRNDPRRLVKRLFEQTPALAEALPEMPVLVHRFLKQQTEPELSNGPSGVAARSGHGGRQLGVTGRQIDAGGRAMQYTIAAAALLVSEALIAAALLISGRDGLPWWLWLSGAATVWWLVKSLFRR